MLAELAYLFRHALLRDAAYQLQLPGDRARLHALAFELIEALAGGRAPEWTPLASANTFACKPHPTDPFAQSLAQHACIAWKCGYGDSSGTSGRDLRAAHRLYLCRSASHSDNNFQPGVAERLWQEHSELVLGAERGDSLRRTAVAAFQAGHLKVAQPLLEQALTIHRQGGDRHLVALSLDQLAIVFHVTGRMELAERTYTEALTIHRETGRLGLAESSHMEALAIHRELRRRLREGLELGNLAIVFNETGRTELAEGGHTEALAIHREVGNRRSVGITLGNLGSVYLDTKRYELARQCYSEALAIHREVGNRRSEGIVLGNLARVFQETSRGELAGRTYEEAIAIHREVQNRRVEGEHLCLYAMLLLARSQFELARKTWRQGASVLRQIGDARMLKLQSLEMRRACTGAGVLPFDEPPA